MQQIFINAPSLFDVSKLSGKLARIRDWMRLHKLSPRLTFYLLGIISTIWFLIRVVPKPSRASYPCMRVAAPFMSAFVVYILTLGGITIALQKARQNFYRARYIASGSFVLLVLFGIFFTVVNQSQDASALASVLTGPDDGPNQPMGEGIGIHPGRVVWAWDPGATNENISGRYYNPENNNQEVISGMLKESVNKLAGETNVKESWDAIFRSFNTKKHAVSRGYTPGEKIFIKINQTTGRAVIDETKRKNGDYTISASTSVFNGDPGTCQTSPHVTLALLRQLVNQCGIDQSDIAIGDPQNPLFAYNYDVWSDEFPNILYTDKLFGTHGRTLIHESTDDLIFYSDKRQNEKLFDIIENADYMINMANLKPHGMAGITLSVKNHFGSQSRETAQHLHYTHVARKGFPINAGYRKYRVMVDLMGSKYLGRNTVLVIVDGLFGGGARELGPPVKYYMPPFNNDWCNSIFISEDQVALESVCYDFLRTEWNGINKHSTTNNEFESTPNVNGVDDYLHQAADKANWPEGLSYDPESSGKSLPSLGVHEHWNDPVKKQYSRNLGKSEGIELIMVSSDIAGPKDAGKVSESEETDTYDSGNPDLAALKPDTESNVSNFKSVSIVPFGEGFTARNFYSGLVDDKNVKWFLTDKGVVRMERGRPVLHSEIPPEDLRSLACQSSSMGSKVWIASPLGVISADVPFESNTTLEVYNAENSALLGDSVIAIATGGIDLQWIGTEKGVSGLFKNKWLTPSYEYEFPAELFDYYPITTMATNGTGDSVYVATLGAGVGRFHRNDLDGISGASPYAQWGPCLLPSDNVYSICVKGGTQWYGTDAGLARHDGNDYMTQWTAYTIETGLVNNFVQTIAIDSQGKLWVGTKGGISVFDGSHWTSYTTEVGLISNNILSIVCDADGAVYIGTDNGYMIYNNGELVCFQKSPNTGWNI